MAILLGILLGTADVTIISTYPGSCIHVQTTCVDQRHTAGVKWNNRSSCRWLVRSASGPWSCSLNASRWWTGLVEFASTKPARHRSQCKCGISRSATAPTCTKEPPHPFIVALGAIQVLRNAIFLQIGPHPPPRNINNIEHYTFVTLFSGKSDTPTMPHPHLRYVTLEWPLMLSSWQRISERWVGEFACMIAV